MDDFVKVEVVHATSDAHGPVNQKGGHDFTASPQHLIQLALGAVFHQDTVTWSLGAHTPGGNHNRDRQSAVCEKKGRGGGIKLDAIQWCERSFLT